MVAMQGTAEIVEDAGRIEAARERIFPKYRDRETDSHEADSHETDGGEDDAGSGGSSNALIEVSIGSATLQRY